MKFKCGKTEEEKKEAVKSASVHAEKLMRWHRMFAWLPAHINETECRWLEWVERKYDSVDVLWSDYYNKVLKHRIAPKYRTIPMAVM
jgi:hypothetical protein